MRIVTILTLIALIAFGFLLASCSSLKTDKGTIAGTVFFSDEQTRVAGAWVRALDADTMTIVSETQVDDQARFFFLLPEGSYILSGAISFDGNYSESEQIISVVSFRTTRVFFALADDPPV